MTADERPEMEEVDERKSLAKARKLAASLRQDIRSLSEQLIITLDPSPDMLLDAESLDSRSVQVRLRYSGEIRDIQMRVDELDKALESEGFESDLQPLEAGQFWSIGTFDLRLNHRHIYNGFLEPTLREPIVRPVQERVVAFLIKIGEDDDLLVREHHDAIGWHYHYLNWKKERSDVILAWDTRAKLHPKSGSNTRLHVTKNPRPIFSEKHAERRGQFAARPASWGQEKRASMHAACEPDLDKWELSKFRQPSNGATAVWPTDAVLTPRDVEHSPAGVRSESQRRGNRHRR